MSPSGYTTHFTILAVTTVFVCVSYFQQPAAAFRLVLVRNYASNFDEQFN